METGKYVTILLGRHRQHANIMIPEVILLYRVYKNSMAKLKEWISHIERRKRRV
jgi:hypothetical protein